MTEALITKVTILAIVLLVVIAGSPQLTGYAVRTPVSLRSRLCPAGYTPVVSAHVGIGSGSTQIVECRQGTSIIQTGPQFNTAYRTAPYQLYGRFKPPAYHAQVH